MLNSLDERYGSTYRIRAFEALLRESGYAVEYLEGKNSPLNRLGSLFKAAAKNSFDLLITQKFNPVTLPAIWVARLRGKPVLVDWDDFDPGLQGSRWKRWLSYVCETIGPYFATIITTHSEVIADRATRKGRRVVNLPQGFDDRLFSPRREKKREDRLKWGFSPKDLVVGHLCTFTDGGILDLPMILDSWAKLKQPEIHFLLIGGGPKEPQVLRMIDERDLRSRIRRTGLLSHEEVPSALNAMDVGMVFMRDTPANHARVSFKVIEYLAMNVPVVGQAVGETKRLFGTWITGSDEAHLPQTLLRVLHDRPENDTASTLRPYRWSAIHRDLLNVISNFSMGEKNVSHV